MNMHLFLSVTPTLPQKLCCGSEDTAVSKIDTVPGVGVGGKTLRHQTML